MDQDREHHLDRRTMIGSALGGAAFAASASGDEPADEQLPHPTESRKGDMLYRSFGNTGQTVSAIGVGGSHVGQIDESLAIKLVRTAIDRGVTFMDNSWDYNDGDGQGEIKMGKALRDGYRERVFLMTKLDGRTKEAANKQLDESLKRLQTDHVELLQFHEVIRMEDADRFFGPDGALETFEAARKAGKTKFVGFTGHKDPAIHLRMIELAKQHGYHFDAVLFPSNPMDYTFRSFVHQVMPVALKEGMAVQTMKPMGGKHLLASKAVTATECLQYALSQPASVVIHGMETMDQLEHALGVVKSFKPMTAAQITALADRAKQAASTGKFELYKTTMNFDSTAKNPSWLG